MLLTNRQASRFSKLLGTLEESARFDLALTGFDPDRLSDAGALALQTRAAHAI